MDARLFEAINQMAGKSPWLDEIMILSAEYLAIFFVIVLAIMYLYFPARSQRTACLAGVAVLAALVITQTIGFLFPQPGPYLVQEANLLIRPGSNPSFISDSATFCFSVATMIWLHSPKAGVFFAGLAGLEGFSDVYVGTHYPLDVLAAAVLGNAVSLIVGELAKRDQIRLLLDKWFQDAE